MSVQVYIIYSKKTDKRYIGQTSDLFNRINQHNAGTNTSTKFGIPWVLIASKSFETRAEAMNVERKIKNLKSRLKQNEFILKHNFSMHEVIGPENLDSVPES
jgi:putative endonuclease